MLMIKDLGMWNFSTLDVMSWWNNKVTSLTAPSDISSFAVVALRRTKPSYTNVTPNVMTHCQCCQQSVDSVTLKL